MRWLLTIAVTGAISCAVAAKTPPQAPGARPWWLVAGSGATTILGDRQFIGVASAAEGIKHPAMRRSNADTRARAALAVVLNGFVTRLVRRAPKLQKPPPQGPGEIPQWVLDATRRMMDAIKILDHKILPDGSEYALATVRLEEVKNAYRVALDPVDREPLLAAMESAFEESLAE